MHIALLMIFLMMYAYVYLLSFYLIRLGDGRESQTLSRVGICFLERVFCFYFFENVLEKGPYFTGVAVARAAISAKRIRCRV